MREAARAKAGFYPAPPEALEHVLQHIKPAPGSSVHILDPCAGEGDALLQIIAKLGIDEKKTWAIELERRRGQKIRELMPMANVMAPASFFGMKISNQAFSMVYCNPPFDFAVGTNGRQETQFLSRCVDLLVPGGLLLFACPERMKDDWQFRSQITRMFHSITVIEWPADVRHHNEIFILATRRHDGMIVGKDAMWRDRVVSPYELPPAEGAVNVWTKTEVVDDEIIDLLENSPLKHVMETAGSEETYSPPLSLNTGHIALLLSSGHLNGIVHPEGEQPHVVRGTARKTEEVVSVETNDDGKTISTTTKMTERIKLVVRAVWQDGVIHTLEDK